MSIERRILCRTNAKQLLCRSMQMPTFFKATPHKARLTALH